MSEIVEAISALGTATEQLKDAKESFEDIRQDADESVAQAVQSYDEFKTGVKQLVGHKNLLPDPAFMGATLGLGMPSGFGLQVYYGGVATVEVAELTESDKEELAVVLGNSKAFVAKESSAFYEGSIPRKMIINQTVEGTSSSSLRLSCPVTSIDISPLYMKLVKMGAITKKTDEPWVNGAQPGMYFSKGDIDDNKVFQLCMNGVETWEVFMPWLVLESDEMIYSNF